MVGQIPSQRPAAMNRYKKLSYALTVFHLQQICSKISSSGCNAHPAQGSRMM
jgi:hypothetical protein